MKLMTLVTSLSLFLSFSQGWTQTRSDAGDSADLMCRLKAKEVAAEAYRGCLSEARTQQVDQLKKEYQDRLRQMKEEYERELKKVGGASTTKKSSSPSIATKKSNNKQASPSVATNRIPRAKATTPNPSMEEMNVELKSAPSMGFDESVMDLPEPISVESSL